MAYREAKHAALIADTAVKLFKRDGYEHVSVNDICQKAGISRSSFYMAFSGKRDVIDYILDRTKANETAMLEGMLDADNDFERMWSIAHRYLQVALEFGPTLTGSLMQLELDGSLDILKSVHAVSDWYIRLTRNCQKSGVILSTEPAELLAPMATEMAYMVTYKWCCTGAGFPLIREARIRAEMCYNVAPEYRMTEEQLDALDP